MTPEERYDDTFCGHGVGVLCKTCVVRAIRAAEQDAHACGRAEMREECASAAVCTFWQGRFWEGDYEGGSKIAAAIRALK